MTDERLQTDDLVAEADADNGDADAALARDDSLEPLFDDGRAKELRDKWGSLQARFVDDPRDTVAGADSLVAELLQELARSFNEARSSLEEQWSRGDDVSTEDLRVTLQRYRSFFERLLQV